MPTLSNRDRARTVVPLVPHRGAPLVADEQGDYRVAEPQHYIRADEHTDGLALAADAARSCVAADSVAAEAAHTRANSTERTHRLIFGGTALLLAIVGLVAAIAWGSSLAT